MAIRWQCQVEKIDTKGKQAEEERTENIKQLKKIKSQLTLWETNIYGKLETKLIGNVLKM